MISHRRVWKGSEELSYNSAWSLVMVRNQLPAQAVKTDPLFTKLRQYFKLSTIFRHHWCSSPLYLHTRDVLRMAHIMPLCIFLSVEENSHGSDVIQKFPARQNPEISPGIGAPIPVNPFKLKLLIRRWIVHRWQMGRWVKGSSQPPDSHSGRLVS